MEMQIKKVHAEYLAMVNAALAGHDLAQQQQVRREAGDLVVANTAQWETLVDGKWISISTSALAARHGARRV